MIGLFFLNIETIFLPIKTTLIKGFNGIYLVLFRALIKINDGQHKAILQAKIMGIH